MTRRLPLSKTGKKNVTQQPTCSSMMSNVAPLSDDEILGVRRRLAERKPSAPLPVGLYSITSDEMEAVRESVLLTLTDLRRFPLSQDWDPVIDRLKRMLDRFHIQLLDPDGSPK